MANLSELYDILGGSNPEVVSIESELTDSDILELSTEAIGYAAKELEDGINFVVSLEELYDRTFESEVSTESAVDFIDSLESLIEVSGLDVPIEVFVSMESLSDVTDKASEAGSKLKGTLSEKAEELKKKAKESGEKIVNSKTAEKVRKVLDASKKWIETKAKSFDKWLVKRLEAVNVTATKMKNEVEANEKALKDL